MKKEMNGAAVSAGIQSFVGNAVGSPVHALSGSGMNTNALRPYIAEDGRPYITINGVAVRANAALLQKDEWKTLDRSVIQIARQRLNGIADLQNRGLVRNLGGLGVMTDEWEDVSDMEAANVDMAGATRGEEDSAVFQTQGVPIPIIHKNFRINIRRLLASRRQGAPIDTTQAETSSRLVRDGLENMLFNGVTLKSDGYNIYGYTTYPNRLRTNIATAWDSATTSILTDVEHMLATMHAAYHFGPFVMYVPTNYYSVLIKDYSSYKNGTFLDRILAYPDIEAVKPADVLTSTEIVMVEMARDVVDLAVGQDITTVEWESQGGMISHYKVMAAMAPRLKKDGNGNTGILHAFEAGASTTTTAA